MFKLEDKHLEAAQEIVKKHRTKKNCKNCYDRGWIGVNEQNLLVICTKCVDLEASMAEWKDYVGGHEDLKEHFSELFEEKPAEKTEEGSEKVIAHEHKKQAPQPKKQVFTPGQKRTSRSSKV